MAFRFKVWEPFDEGFKRIAAEQIERAQLQLKEAEDPSIVVHETRKCLKRLRALLRLVRPALGEAVYQAENAQLREIGRGLAGVRDRYVLLETVTKLDAASSAPRKDIGPAMRDLLHVAKGDKGPAVDAAAMRQAQTRLVEAKKRLARLRLPGHGFAIVGPGLEASYRRARRALRAAYAEPTNEAFHEWRKGTQQHWRHMLLLSRAWPECLGARVGEARALSQLLGDDHDLALLIAFVRSEAAAPLGSEKASIVETIARQRQNELRAIARPAGLRLFAERGKALHRRVAAYWEAATALKAHAPDEDEVRRSHHRRASAAPRRRPPPGP